MKYNITEWNQNLSNPLSIYFNNSSSVFKNIIDKVIIDFLIAG